MNKKLKQKIINYKGGKCIRCGYFKCNTALELHHRDPNQKDFSLAAAQTTKFHLLKPEIDKCELVCANCHREIHEEIKESGIKLSSKKDEVIRRPYRLTVRRKSKIIWPNSSELSNLITQYTYVQVGHMLDVSDQAVRKHCVKLGIALPGLLGKRPGTLLALAKRPQPAKKHGNSGGYKRGCKCEECIRWCREHWREKRKRIKDKLAQ